MNERDEQILAEHRATSPNPARKHPYWPDLADEDGDILAVFVDTICGGCVEGRCHWGGAASRESIAAVKAGRDYEHPLYGRCGCDRHADSVAARRFEAAGDGNGDRSTIETALAWWLARCAP